jgi:hypothetical protein
LARPFCSNVSVRLPLGVTNPFPAGQSHESLQTLSESKMTSALQSEHQSSIGNGGKSHFMNYTHVIPNKSKLHYRFMTWGCRSTLCAKVSAGLQQKKRHLDDINHTRNLEEFFPNLPGYNVNIHTVSHSWVSGTYLSLQSRSLRRGGMNRPMDI